jgi:hypothetical protein
MACLLTQGFPLDCKESVGGIQKIFITELANKATISPTGEVTAFTLDQGKQFWEYDLREESSSYDEVITVNNVNGTVFYEQSTVFVLDPRTTLRVNEIALLAKNDVMVIVLDSNGRYWLQGEVNGAYVSAGSIPTGTAKGDLSGFNITLLAKEKIPAREVSSTLIAALTAPAA